MTLSTCHATPGNSMVHHVLQRCAVGSICSGCAHQGVAKEPETSCRATRNCRRQHHRGRNVSASPPLRLRLDGLRKPSLELRSRTGGNREKLDPNWVVAQLPDSDGTAQSFFVSWTAPRCHENGLQLQLWLKPLPADHRLGTEGQRVQLDELAALLGRHEHRQCGEGGLVPAVVPEPPLSVQLAQQAPRSRGRPERGVADETVADEDCVSRPLLQLGCRQLCLRHSCEVRSFADARGPPAGLLQRCLPEAASQALLLLRHCAEVADSLASSAELQEGILGQRLSQLPVLRHFPEPLEAQLVSQEVWQASHVCPVYLWSHAAAVRSHVRQGLEPGWCRQELGDPPHPQRKGQQRPEFVAMDVLRAVLVQEHPGGVGCAVLSFFGRRRQGPGSSLDCLHRRGKIRLVVGVHEENDGVGEFAEEVLPEALHQALQLLLCRVVHQRIDHCVFSSTHDWQCRVRGV
mmetsp:Transcript_13559/g.24384  ORF Transcript_13559/g.24384 Transcript_13559/m.24384 type:complete len:461 (+) Transcript_13559:637-2019(+)